MNNPNNMLVTYIRDSKKRPIGCLVGVVTKFGTKEVVSIGISVCNTKHDTFSKKIGKELALKRANDPDTSYELYAIPKGISSGLSNKDLSIYKDSIYDFMHNIIECFTERCVSYFKDTRVLVPSNFTTTKW